MTGAMPAANAGAAPGRYGGDPRRLVVLVAVVAFHVAVALLLLTSGHGISMRGGSGGAAAGELAVFELPASTASAPPREGGGNGPEAAYSDATAAMRGADARRAGSGDRDDSGEAALGEELARLLADDPLSGGGHAPYDVLLRRHIARYSRPPTDAAGRRYTGVVVVRFRVARDGGVIDARVLHSRGALLDEAALAALWRAEPLPRVPGEFDTPLEVDVPIDFKANG